MRISLSGSRVLVTRPQQDARSLVKKISNAGGIALAAPTLAIHPRPLTAELRTIVGRLKSNDLAIFVSKNAARLGLAIIDSVGQSLSDLTVCAVGPGTKSVLTAAGVDGVIVPQRDFSSDGLLALKQLSSASVKDRQVIIFRGVGGREDLRSALLKRGASVEYCEVYERTPAGVSIAKVLAEYQLNEPDIAIITSLEGLAAFANKIDEEKLERLYDTPLLVVGRRIAREVPGFGFTTDPIIVDNLADETILDALNNWIRKRT